MAPLLGSNNPETSICITLIGSRNPTRDALDSRLRCAKCISRVGFSLEHLSIENMNYNVHSYISLRLLYDHRISDTKTQQSMLHHIQPLSLLDTVARVVYDI